MIKNLPSSIREYTPELIEQDLTFLGLIAMQDPPRSEVKEAVELCHSAGIKIVMIIVLIFVPQIHNPK